MLLAPRRPGRASMGPRSWDRGERAARGGARSHRFRASMGPRSWDRGERAAADALACVCELQWGRGLGTAERQPRCPPLTSTHNDRFNGAAVLGPRRASSPPGRRLANNSLQWGRGLGTAERWTLRPRTCCVCSLQWGRGLGTAERWIPVAHGLHFLGSFNGAAVLGPRRVHKIQAEHNPLHLLQWGRGLGTAESLKPLEDEERALLRFNGAAVLGPRRGGVERGLRQKELCFNGAAVLGPRRGIKCACNAMAARMLQWGRGLGTAERSAATALLGGPLLASMGPRSWDRGESPG